MKQFILIILVHCTSLSMQQRVAPGVPPQHYQPPAHQQHQPQYQHQQQQQQQYQPQVPVNHQVPIQQVPIQQQVPMHQQVPIQQQVPMHQQVPIQQQQQQFQPQHVAHDPHQMMPGQILNAANMEHEKEHMAEHLNVNVDTSKMSEQELQFHYFKMHDADNNNKLDGCELIKSLIHWHGDDPASGAAEPLPVQTDEELQALVDPLLLEVDQNKDGYIDYSEFKQNEANRP